jgi:cytoskeleton protein RodZ
MKKTGAFLKAEREKRNISLNEISLAIKINSKVLRAIEDGDPAGLPAKTFLRGFVLSYATALKVDTDAVMAMFYEEMGSTKLVPKIDPKLTENGTVAEGASEGLASAIGRVEVQNNRALGEDVVAPINAWPTSRKILVFGGTVVLLLLIMVTQQVIEKYEKETEVANVTVEDPIPQGIEASAGEEVSGSPSTTTESEAVVPLTPAPTTPEASAAKTAADQKASDATQKTTPLPPKDAPAATANAAPTAAPDAANLVKADAQIPVPEKKAMDILVEALDSVTIEYANGDGKTGKVSLSADQAHSFKGKTGMVLNVSNGGAINITINGRDKGVPGNPGQPIKLSY